MPRPAVAPARPALAALALAACGGEGGRGDGGPEPVAAVRFAVASDTLTAGVTRAYPAAAVNGAGAPLAGRAVTYASSDTARATVDAAGRVRALAPGAVTITAASGGRTGALALTVGRAPPARVTLAGVDSALTGDEGTLAAAVVNTLGAADPSYAVAFASDAPAVAAVDAAGRVTALAPGVATFTARTDGPSGVLVSPGVRYVVLAPVAALRVLPLRVAQGVGAATPLAVQARDATGAVLDRAVTLGTTGGAARLSAAVAGGGAAGGPVVVTGAEAGAGTVTATASFRGRNVVTATVPVTTTPVAAGPYAVELRFDGAVDPAYAALFRRAAAYWETVVTAALPAESVALDADECGRAHPAVRGVTTGVIVTVRVDSIDGPGGVLGAAGPCWLRDGPNGTHGLPAYGTVRFDSADVAAYVRSGVAYDVMRHEIGHVLGIGSLWPLAVHPRTAPLLTGRATAAAAYVGEGGAEGSATLGFTGAGEPAAVETRGGPGTADAHWREAVYDAELMTGYVNPGANPASRLTVLSLGDLGYAVNAAAAEPLLPASASSAGVRAALQGVGAPRAPGAGAQRLAEEVVRARFAGTRGGGRRRLPDAGAR